MGDSDETLTTAQKVKFAELCEVFEALRNTKTSKRLVFDKFVRHWRDSEMHRKADGSYEFSTRDTFYDAMRIFLPSQDNREYRIKESKLNNLVCKKVLMTEQLTDISSYSFVERLVEKANSLHPIQQAKLSVAEVNDYLDRMKYPNNIIQQEEALKYLVRSCTSSELRWIFHVIIGDLESTIGIAHPTTLLNWFHPQAVTYLREGNSLQDLCRAFVGEECGDGILQSTGNLLCKPFQPMLLKRLSYNKDCLPKIIKNCKRPFYVEVKFDGEHLLLHKYGQNQYKYFTRNGADYTHKMGPDSGSLLSARIHPFFLPTVRECVLDCELLIWDKKLQTFVGKGKRASDGNVYDVKHLDDDFFKNRTLFERSIAVFDILYLNGTPLLRIPLEERLKLLEKVFKEEDKSIIFVSRKELIRKAEDLVNYYRNAMNSGEEGIVVKAMHSTYHPGSRAEKNGWFKIKPDYGIQSVLDLAVVGIRFENDSLSNVKSFLVAARRSGQGDSLRFKIVAGVTSRLRMLDYQRLRTLLEANDEPLLEEVPEWLTQPWARNNAEMDGNGGRANGNGKKAVRYVPRDNIQVVEVRASGLINGYLQFPSIASIRTDKLVDEIDTMEDVLQFDQRLRSRPIIDDTDKHEAVVMLNRKRRQNLQLKSTDELVKTVEGDQGRLSKGLGGRKVCVLNGNAEASAQELQKILISLGATINAQPVSSTDFAVAMNPKDMKCAAAFKADKFNIVHGRWLLRCREQKRLIQWDASDIIHQSKGAQFDLFSTVISEEEERQEEEEGEEGDDQNYDEEEQIEQGEEEGEEEAMSSTEGETEEVQNGEEEIEDRGGKAQKVVETDDETEMAAAQLLISGDDCQPVERGNLFADYVFFLHESALREGGQKKMAEIQAKIEAQNGRVHDTLDETVTHVLVGRMRYGEETPLFAWNEKQQFLGQFVTGDWLDKSVADGDRYRLPVRINELIG